MLALQVDQVMADSMVEKAIQMCGELKFLGDAQQTRQALRMSRCDVCSTVSQCLIRQVSEYLGQLDHNIKAVYQYEPELTSLRQGVGAPKAALHPAGVNLLVYVERKNAALLALAETLQNALYESRKRGNCIEADPACYSFDIQVVDDREVLDKRGLGILASSRFVRSMQVWSRDEFSEEAAPPEMIGDRILLSSFDPEITPESTLFEQALAIEKLPPAERQPYAHRLREIKVALIRRMISDQLAYINIAKEWFTIGDLADIFHRKIGYGRIGGKSAGMLLAKRILLDTMDEMTLKSILVPDSYYVGSDVMYLFMAMNGLMHYVDQKYKSEAQNQDEYPGIRDEFMRGEFPPEVIIEFQTMLDQIGPKPIIVRSSSLLEDNFGASFAGKYESIFLPNHADPHENLIVLMRAISRIYASALKPDTLLYRRGKGLLDYDERMAVLIQPVQGEPFGRYYFPLGAGVAFSRNLYRWAPQIRKEDGFVRLVWGLGTRAVERVGDDFPRILALSHPNLQPDDTPEAIRYYSQRYIDLIDLEENCFKTLPVHEVIRPDYPGLRYLTQVEEEGYLSTPRGLILKGDIPKLVITFDEFIRRSPFAATMNRVLRTLEEHYHTPVDLEFTLKITGVAQAKPDIQISLLQCRPQSTLQAATTIPSLRRIEESSVIFQTSYMVPQGYITGIQKVIYIDPAAYFQLRTQVERSELRGLISQLNKILPKKSFICVGPGRWGTINPDLGVFVSYADVHQAAALVELSGKAIGSGPEPSLGTHFYQDLMEAAIYPVAVCLDHSGSMLNREFFDHSPNRIAEVLPQVDPESTCLRLLDVAAYRPGHHLDIIMDEDEGKAVAYLAADVK